MKFNDNIGNEDSKNFVKMKDKESVRGVFFGDIYEFFQHWEQGEKNSTLCTGAGCVRCKTKPAAFRFRVNFAALEGSGLVSKIFEQGATVYKQLRELNQDYRLEDYFVKITRNGTDRNTTYTILPLPDGKITPERRAKLNALTPIELRHSTPLPETDTHSGPSAPPLTDEHQPPLTEEDLPF